MKKIVFGLICIVIVFTGVFGGKRIWKTIFPEDSITVYSTQEARTGDMRRTISSTGTVEPEELVNVGAQIGGMITEFGKDSAGKAVDYGSLVKANTVLAKIDDSLYKAERDAAEANVLQTEAAIASSQATLKQAQAKYELAKANLDRTKLLFQQGITPQNEYDSAISEFDSADATKALAEANLKQSNAQHAAAKASLAKALRNLEYCTISSPVDGVIIDRRVNIGQTVNASMNAPSLFLIARDLKKMQVWVSVNEADVGEIKPGGKVEFSVDAFPGRTFQGTVRKTRLNATMSQNVVTFVVEIDTDNSDGTLLPYLTANVKFILEERNQVLMVPNAAFRFTPDPASGLTAPQSTAPGEKVIWVKNGNRIHPEIVKTGMNDGAYTELLSGQIAAGAQIVTGSQVVTRSEQAQNAGSGDSNNPFLPKMPPPPGSKKK